MTIKYNTDPAGNIKVITKDGKVSCECCCLFGPPPDPTLGVEITRNQFRALLRGGSCSHSYSVTFTAGSTRTPEPQLSCQDDGFSGTTEVFKNTCFIGTFNVGGNAQGSCRFWTHEGKYRFVFGTFSQAGDRFLYLSFSDKAPPFSALIPNSYLSNFTGSITIDGEALVGNWYHATGSCGYPSTGSVQSASASIAITTNAP
jgi:hypothetical protein